MGYVGAGLPFALDARLATSDRPVCLLAGDGAFGFHPMALETTAREGLLLVLVVAVDDAWGTEKAAYRLHGLPLPTGRTGTSICHRGFLRPTGAKPGLPR